MNDDIEYFVKNKELKAHCSNCCKNITLLDVEYDCCFANTQEKYDSSLLGKTPCWFKGIEAENYDILNACVSIKKRTPELQKSSGQDALNWLITLANSESLLIDGALAIGGTFDSPYELETTNDKSEMIRHTPYDIETTTGE